MSQLPVAYTVVEFIEKFITPVAIALGYLHPQARKAGISGRLQFIKTIIVVGHGTTSRYTRCIDATDCLVKQPIKRHWITRIRPIGTRNCWRSAVVHLYRLGDGQ